MAASRRRRVSPKQRLLFLKSVPPQSKQFLSRLEGLPGQDPDFENRLAKSVERYDADVATDTVWTFALAHQPHSNFLGKVMMATPKGLCIVDPQTFRCNLAIDWAWLCRFDIKHDGNYQIVGVTFFCGEGHPADRAKSGKPLADAEVELWYFYTHTTADFFEYVIEAADEADVLSVIDDGVSLL